MPRYVSFSLSTRRQGVSSAMLLLGGTLCKLNSYFGTELVKKLVFEARGSLFKVNRGKNFNRNSHLNLARPISIEAAVAAEQQADKSSG